jgi:hypothetical protein
MRRFLLAAAALALALPAGAAAGGWATVGVTPLPPDDIGPGSGWTATLNVLQHGRTPLDGVQPVLTIRNVDTGATRDFAARPSGDPGRYVVDVEFPAAGTWAYEVDDGFGGLHTYAPVAVGPGDGGTSLAPWLAAVAAALTAAALATGWIVRRRRPAALPAPTTG